VLYTRYVYFFEGAGLVLLVAMIGAIVLTLRHRGDVKRRTFPTRLPAAQDRCRSGQGEAGAGPLRQDASCGTHHGNRYFPTI
jgi:hypothetical protein